MGLPLYLSPMKSVCSQEATVRTRHGTMDWERSWEQLGKKYIKAVFCLPAYLTYMTSTSCKMPEWMRGKLESRFLGEISITSEMQMTLPYGRKQRGTKEPLDEGEGGV